MKASSKPKSKRDTDCREAAPKNHIHADLPRKKCPIVFNCRQLEEGDNQANKKMSCKYE